MKARLPICAVCNKPVDELSESHDFKVGETVISIRCHGERKTIRVPDDIWIDAELGSLMLGMAFVPESTKLPKP